MGRKWNRRDEHIKIKLVCTLFAVKNHRTNNNNDMNNLQKMYNWLIENQDKIKPNFNINYYREYNNGRNHECNSTGYLIRWDVGAFSIEEIPIRKQSKMILFSEFSKLVLRMGSLTSSKWKFIFDSEWHYTEYNSFDDAMSRYKHVLDGKPIEDHNQYKTFLKYVK